MAKEYKKKVLVRDIAKYFNLEQITGDETSLNRWVVVADMNRPGFELSGYFKFTEPRRIVIIGQKEIEYISHMTEQEQRDRYPKITDGFTPMLVVTRNNEVPPILIEIGKQLNFPIFRTPQETSRFQVDLVSYLDEKLAPEDTISGVLLVVYGMGVLLTGESGIGKSETALELIRNGQVLVADDRVDVQRIHNHIHGHSPELLKGRMELRGIGIIDAQRMYGASCVKDRNRIELVIELKQYNPNAEYERVGDITPHYTNILNVMIPTIIMPVSPGRSVSALIESAVTNFQLKQSGYDASQQFREDLHAFLLKEDEEIKKND